MSDQRIQLLEEQVKFLLGEIRRINEERRRELLEKSGAAFSPVEQTKESFDYQWREIPDGVAMPGDSAFMQGVEARLCEMTALPTSWFPGKSVIDVGCGAGRWSLALLRLGAKVTACDQSAFALARTADLCRAMADRLTLRQADLLTFTEPASFDLAFSFGVVHHTGNTYLAMRNVANKVRPAGRLFHMIYGFPANLGEFAEINAYEDLRRELRIKTLEEKRQLLIARFGAHLAHGWFDAVSPAINDLLTFEEIHEVLSSLGYGNIQRTVANRNVHIVAQRAS